MGEREGGGEEWVRVVKSESQTKPKPCGWGSWDNTKEIRGVWIEKRSGAMLCWVGESWKSWKSWESPGLARSGNSPGQRP